MCICVIDIDWWAWKWLLKWYWYQNDNVLPLFNRNEIKKRQEFDDCDSDLEISKRYIEWLRVFLENGTIQIETVQGNYRRCWVQMSDKLWLLVLYRYWWSWWCIIRMILMIMFMMTLMIVMMMMMIDKYSLLY